MNQVVALKRNYCTYSHFNTYHWGHYNLTLSALLLYVNISHYMHDQKRSIFYFNKCDLCAFVSSECEHKVCYG